MGHTIPKKKLRWSTIALSTHPSLSPECRCYRSCLMLQCEAFRDSQVLTSLCSYRTSLGIQTLVTTSRSPGTTITYRICGTIRKFVNLPQCTHISVIAQFLIQRIKLSQRESTWVVVLSIHVPLNSSLLQLYHRRPQSTRFFRFRRFFPESVKPYRA